MIPMRRYIIVEEHGVLPFPEGTACAEILKTAEKSMITHASIAVVSFCIAVFYKLMTNVFYIIEELPRWIIPKFEKTEFSLEATPALLGVGYIIGPRIASMMLAGGALSWWVIIPLIHMFGSKHLIIFPSAIPIEQMSAQELWSSYVRYIGAGAVAMGRIISLVKIGPVIYKTVHVGVKELLKGFKPLKKVKRTEKDISLAWLILGSIAIVLALWLIPITKLNLFTVILLIVLGFFFVAVTSIQWDLLGVHLTPTPA